MVHLPPLVRVCIGIGLLVAVVGYGVYRYVNEDRDDDGLL